MISRGRGSRQGAQTGVQQALGWKDGREPEAAQCTICSHALQFTTGDYGQTLEICTNTNCQGCVPHKPRPDPAKPTARRRF